jgi:excisionase family DNA binding protein
MAAMSTETVSIPEAARLMNVTTLDYVYRLVWAGRLRASKVNGKWRVEKSSVMEHIGRVSAKRSARTFAERGPAELPDWLVEAS